MTRKEDSTPADPAPRSGPEAAAAARRRRALITVGAVLLGFWACVLPVAGRQEQLVDRLMLAVFGTGWAFNDFFSVVLVPFLGAICLPAAAVIGAAAGLLAGRWLAGRVSL